MVPNSGAQWGCSFNMTKHFCDICGAELPAKEEGQSYECFQTPKITYIMLKTDSKAKNLRLSIYLEAKDRYDEEWIKLECCNKCILRQVTNHVIV